MGSHNLDDELNLWLQDSQRSFKRQYKCLLFISGQGQGFPAILLNKQPLVIEGYLDVEILEEAISERKDIFLSVTMLVLAHQSTFHTFSTGGMVLPDRGDIDEEGLRGLEAVIRLVC